MTRRVASHNPRWLRIYYVLAALTAMTIASTLYLIVRVTREFNTAVAVDHDWDLRREAFDSLSTLAFTVEAPALEVLGAAKPRRELAVIDSAYRGFESMVNRVREEYRRDLPADARGVLSRDLEAVDSSMRAVAGAADSLIRAWLSRPRAGMSRDQQILDRDFVAANAVLARARRDITRIHQEEFDRHRLEAERFHRDVRLLGLAALLMILWLALFGRRLTLTAGETAERERTNFAAIQQSEARYRALAAELEQRVESRTTQLREARAAAESASRAKGDFLANMSHEIRTPMNGVLGMLELAMDTELTALQRDYIGTAFGSAESLLTVINDILDFSKIESGRFELDPVDFALEESLADTVSTLAIRAQEKGLELLLEVEPDVPPAVTGDLGRLRQVVINLVGNAIKFTDRGEVSLRVSRDANGAPDMLHFAVRDTGIGIAAEKQQLVFEAFRQADASTTRQFGGTGLGLAISAALVQMMEGRIWVASEAGKGSTFHFTAALPEADFRVDTAEHAARLRLDGRRVLVVDDNETNRRILATTLERWGMLPTLATNGEDALAVVAAAGDRGDAFDLIVTDADMPRIDGFGLVQRLRSEPAMAAHTVLMLSSARHRHEVERCRALGIDRYLIKPIRQSQLRAAILGSLAGDHRERIAAPRRPGTQMAAHTRSLRILVAEDNAVNQKLARAILERAGHRVVLAENGGIAAELARDSDFDAILMDVQMPTLGGFAATGLIREWERRVGGHTPIIAVTAHAMEGDREACLAAGMDGYLSKPLRAGAVLEAIEAVVPAGRQSASTSGDAPPSGLFDRPALLDMLGGDTGLFDDIVQTFLREAPRQRDAIAAAAAASDAGALRESSHSLKGAAATITAARLARVAETIEAAARHGQTNVTDLLVELDGSFAELRQLLEHPDFQR